jgi:hypothetical protein
MQATLLPKRVSTENEARMHLLRHLLEELMWEFRAVRENRWEDLPQLFEKKRTLIEQLNQFDWAPLPYDRENLELLSTKGQVIDLQFQIRKALDGHLAVLRAQLDELKKRHTRWRHATSPYRQMELEQVHPYIN